METSPSPHRRLAITIGVTGVVLAALIGVGIYGLVATDDHAPSGPRRPESPSRAPKVGEQELLSWQDLPSLPETEDPIQYARAVASTTFTWSTMSGLEPNDYTNPIIVDADPSGVETNGLITDLRGYLPDEEPWRRLRNHQTAQTLRIGTAYVPNSWAGIVRDNPGRLGRGTVAVTIEGTRHRTGTWLGQRQTSSHEVSLTVFLACRPAYDRCHTLRLSALDKPLR